MSWWDTVKKVGSGVMAAANALKSINPISTSFKVLGQQVAQAKAPQNSLPTAAPKAVVKPTPAPTKPAVKLAMGGTAAVMPAASAPPVPAAPTPTPQHVPINGALYNSAEKQAAAFSNIMVVGTPGQPGSYLAGVPKTTPTINLPGGTYSATPTGEVTPGGETISVPNNVTGSSTEAGGTGSNITTASAIKETAESGNSPDAIANFIKTVQDQTTEYSRLIAGLNVPSAREQELQKKIDDLTGAFKQGKANIEGRPIPLEDIAGQEQQLLQNTEAILSPLTSELTRMQDLRVNQAKMLGDIQAGNAQNNALQFQALQLQQTAATEAASQVRQFAFDMMKEYPTAGITSKDTAAQIAEKVAKDPMYQAKLAETQSKSATKVLGSMTQDEFDRTMKISNEARSDKDILAFGQIRDSFNAMLSANAQVKENPAAGGVADLTMLRAYAKMTDPGGRITDGEFETMGDAVGTLANMGIKWTTGMIQGDRLTQAGRDFFVQQSQMTYDNYYNNYTKAVDFYKNLAVESGVDPNRIIPLITANSDIQSRGGSTSDSSMANIYEQTTGEKVSGDPSIKDEIGADGTEKSLWQKTIDWFQGKPVTAAPATVARIAESIGQFESGGRYEAIGPETKYGRAYGKYQVLSSNIPAWTKEALGTSMSAREFLGNKGAQDAVARYKMAQYLKQFNGDLNKVTIAWFAGPGNASRLSVVDQATGVNGHTYLARVRSIYDGLPA